MPRLVYLLEEGAVVVEGALAPMEQQPGRVAASAGLVDCVVEQEVLADFNFVYLWVSLPNASAVTGQREAFV